MLRKITSVLITVSMLLSLVCVNVSAENGTADSTQLDVLKGLEIVMGYESDETKTFETMQKSTFINFLLNMMYGGKYLAGYDTSALETAEGLGMIDSAAAILESDALRGEEAVKMAMCLLGYKELCLKTGGYPTGFLTKAASIGLTKGVSLSGEMSNGEAYKLLYNTMRTGIADVESLGVYGDTYTRYYTEYDNVTILNVYRDIYEVEGVVTANHTSGLYEAKGASIGEITIEEERYEDPNGILYEYLGSRVLAYAKENEGGEFEIIYGELHEKNETVTFETEDVKNVSSDISTIEYYPDSDADKTRRASIKSSVALLYNNAVYSDYTAEDFKVPSGTVTLIDNDGDNVIDVIKLDVYKVMIVSSVSASTNVINGEYAYTDALAKLELESYTDVGDSVRFFVDGEKGSISDIQAGDVLSVYDSKTEAYKSLEVYITKDKLTATVTGYNTTKKEITAGDIIYELSETYYDANANKESFAQTIAAGGKYEFYFDVRGKIVGARVVGTGDLSYGYLRKVAETKGIQPEYAIKVFGEDGEWKTVYFADKVKVNGESRIEAASAKTRAAGAIGQIVGYSLDKNDEINRLELPVAYTEDVSEERLNVIPEATYNFRYNNTSFDSYHYMTGDTTVFMIPSEELDNEDLYDIGNSYSFTSDESVNYIGYGCDEYGFLDIVLAKRNKDTSKKVGNSLYLVREVGNVADGEGNVTRQITVASSTYLGLSMSAEDESVLTNVNEGDIVRIHVNAKGYVDNLEHKYRISDKDTDLYSPNSLHSYEPVKGKLLKVDITNGRILVESKLSDGKARNVAMKVSKTIPVLIYDAETKDVKAGTISDLSIGDYVIADISKSNVIGLYVMRYFD